MLLEPNVSSGSTRVRRSGEGCSLLEVRERRGMPVVCGCETRAVHGDASVEVRERAGRVKELS